MFLRILSLLFVFSLVTVPFDLGAQDQKVTYKKARALQTSTAKKIVKVVEALERVDEEGKEDPDFETVKEILNELLDKKDSLKFDFIKPRKDISKFVNNTQDLKHLEVIEFSPETNSIFRELINFLLMNNGFFLLIDYGYINLPKISTLQSIKSNKKTDFLDNPGNQDITYHVDFNNLQNILEENKIDDFIINTQSNFLRQNGILDRANILIKKNPKKKKQINEQLAILTKREYMGNLFKVLEINI